MDTKNELLVLQYGEGNFLRAFADWMIDIANSNNTTNLKVIVVSPRFKSNHAIETLKNQNGIYHTILQGIDSGQAKSEIRTINCITKAIAPEVDHTSYLEIAESPELRFVITNTTEAGIIYDNDNIFDTIPRTFPGKVTAMLFHRWQFFKGDLSKGLIFLCCELIENNGSKLKEIVLQHAHEANLDEEFSKWIDTSCIFCDTLVDRIVSGRPTEYPKELNGDALAVAGELYHNWVIGGKHWEKVKEEFPLHKAGLNVIFTPSISQYRERKVRILNGCHTAMVPIALQLGCTTVLEAVDNPLVKRFLNMMLKHEIIPTLDGDNEDNIKFAEEILERFRNPYIKHRLTSILLNSYSKWQTRNWPTAKDIYSRQKEYAKCQLFALGALNALKSKDQYNDIIGPETQYDDLWLGNKEFEKIVREYSQDILNQGMQEALKHFIGDYEKSH